MARKKSEAVQADTAEKENVGADVQTISETETVEHTNAEVNTENEKIKYIYAGVTLPGMKANTVFTGAIPAVLDVPFVRELVMPVDDFTEFLKKKAVTSSREAFCYRKSAEYAKSLKK